eukprot:g31201.t1
MRLALTKFYANRKSDKLGNLDRIVDRYEGRVVELWASLGLKYSLPPNVAVQWLANTLDPHAAVQFASGVAVPASVQEVLMHLGEEPEEASVESALRSAMQAKDTDILAAVSFRHGCPAEQRPGTHSLLTGRFRTRTVEDEQTLRERRWAYEELRSKMLEELLLEDRTWTWDVSRPWGWGDEQRILAEPAPAEKDQLPLTPRPASVVHKLSRDRLSSSTQTLESMIRRAIGSILLGFAAGCADESWIECSGCLFDQLGTPGYTLLKQREQCAEAGFDLEATDGEAEVLKVSLLQTNVKTPTVPDDSFRLFQESDRDQGIWDTLGGLRGILHKAEKNTAEIQKTVLDSIVSQTDTALDDVDQVINKYAADAEEAEMKFVQKANASITDQVQLIKKKVASVMDKARAFWRNSKQQAASGR